MCENGRSCDQSLGFTVMWYSVYSSGQTREIIVESLSFHSQDPQTLSVFLRSPTSYLPYIVLRNCHNSV
jgi:hypothetical protein